MHANIVEPSSAAASPPAALSVAQQFPYTDLADVNFHLTGENITTLVRQPYALLVWLQAPLLHSLSSFGIPLKSHNIDHLLIPSIDWKSNPRHNGTIELPVYVLRQI